MSVNYFFFILAALGVQNYPVIVDDLFIDILLKKGESKKEIDRKDIKKMKEDNIRNVTKNRKS